MPVTLTPFSGDVEIIRPLDNQPNDNGNPPLTADQLKAKFDQFGDTFKSYFNNTFIPQVQAAIEAAAMGVGPSGVDGAYITDGTVTAEKLKQASGSEAVITATVRDGAITKEKCASAVQTILDSVSDKQAEHKTATTTLASGSTSWTQTVTGVRSTNTVIAVAGTDETSYNAWVNCGIRATSQGYDTLTFKARSAPSSNVNVNILILD